MWTRNTTSGILEHSGTSRDYWDPNADFGGSVALPASAEIKAQLAAASHNVKVLVRGSSDGRSGYECGIEGSNVIIRKITYGVVAAAISSAAHGLGASETFTLRVRLTAETIAATVVKTSGAEVPVSHATTDRNRFNSYGFVSNVNGAKVLSATLAEVGLSSVLAEDVLVIVAGGDVWATANDGERLQAIGYRAFPTEAQVSLAVLDGKVYGVGGGKAVIIDPGARTVSAWVPTSGSLPGSTGTGTTTASTICSYRGRIWLAVQPNLLYASAVGEPLTWDTGELAEGRAEVIGVGRNQEVSDAIVALSVSTVNTMIVACKNSVYAMIGDPADNGGEVVPIGLTTGCSGPRAITTVAEGFTAFHSPEGLYVVGSGSALNPVSSRSLTRFIQFPRADRDNYKTLLVRDPSRHGLHIIITPTTGTATHFYYDERVGRYSAGAGGFFPERYSKSITAGTIWKGRPIFGTSDGYLVEFDDVAESDQGDTAIDAYFALSLCDEQYLDNDTVINQMIGLLGSNSDPVTVTLYGGKSPEAAYDSSERYQLGQWSVTSVPNKMLVRQRGPALVMQVRNNTASQSFTFERLEVLTTVAKPIHRAGWKAALAVGAPCPVPTGSSAASNSGASAVSGPGAGSLPAGGSAGSGFVSGVFGGSGAAENGGGIFGN